ncbi:hypothetical protein B7494_g4638 [Chlorociboria aeruginascens]|nr:hypothetical protein B7494_g4638 [Chlorociboria aeruginascens]
MVLFLHVILVIISAVIAQTALDYERIRNTLSRYPLAVDGKKFSNLSLVFTKDAVGYYPTPLNTLTGLPDIETQLEASLRPVQTHHSYGTQEITVYHNRTADAVT